MASLSCGTGTRTPSPLPPGPSPTPWPVETEPPAATTSGGDASSPTTEATADDAYAIVEITDLILGVSARGYSYYAMGSTAGGVGGSRPYLFIDPNACGMKLEVRTRPTSALPGSTALEALQAIFQEDYVGAEPEDWTITVEPFELELNGESAARLEATHLRGDSISLYQITVIRGQERSAVVQGQIGEGCMERPASVDSLNEMTGSVSLHDPAAVCYVGQKPGADPAEYAVGCDYPTTGVTGQGALADREFSEIVLGPATWDECAEFMREHDQPYWE
jgi:hypothetical protein